MEFYIEIFYKRILWCCKS